MSVLDLGSGLGGATRAVAANFAAWVTGLESDHFLSLAGDKISEKLGLMKKAEIRSFDPRSYEPPSRGFDHMISRERFYTFPNRQGLPRRPPPGLKSRGHIALTDLVLAKPTAASAPAVAEWSAAEAVVEPPWTVDDHVAALAEFGIETHVREDLTQRYRGFANAGWAAFLKTAAKDEWQDERAHVLAAEVNLSRLRGAALDSGALRVCRIHAIAKE